MRPRRAANRDLEPHVYPPAAGKRIYRYYDRRNGRIVSLKTDNRALANKRGRTLNAAIAEQLADLATQQILAGPNPNLTVAQWSERYIEQQERRLADKDIKPATLEVTRTRIRNIVTAHGALRLSEVNTRHVHQLIQDYTDADKRRSAQQIRTVYRDLLNAAVAAGEVETNVADATKAPRQRTKRARLTLENFLAIREHTEGWATNLLNLALVTGQRREDLREMKFRDARDGRLHIVQRKTGARIRIPTALRLKAVDLSIEDVIAQCLDKAASPYLIHHQKHAGAAKPGDIIRATTMSQAFAEARDASGIEWKGTNPSLHELRSLSARLYEREGVNAKVLLGHTTDRMAATYQDSRGAEWIDLELTSF